MKSSAVIVIVLLALTHLCAAQSSSCWTDITSWTASFTLSGSGSGSCTGYNECNASDKLTANNVKMTPGFLSCQPASVGSSGTTSNFTGQLNDTATIPCPPSGEDQSQWQGITGGLAASGLSIDQSSGTYIYEVEGAGNGTFTELPCGGQPITQNLPLGILPTTNYPQPLALPSNVGALDSSYQFDGQEDVLFLVIPWTLSFTLTPNYDDDDDCKDKGDQPGDLPGDQIQGDPFPVSSTVGCQNQSLAGCGKTRVRLIMLSRFGDYVTKGRVLVASAAA